MATDAPRFIVFLPPVPRPPSFSAIKAAFGETVGQVLKEAASHASESSRAAVLEVALACPELVDDGDIPRSEFFATTQSLIAWIYKLICVIAAQEKVNIEDAHGVDVRLILVAWSTDRAAASSAQTPGYGPVITLETLARSPRAWQYAFGIESDAGAAMVQAFVKAKGTGEHISRMEGAPVPNSDSMSSMATSASGPEHAEPKSAALHHHVAVGGTFDHLHIGHKLLLAMTIFSVDNATIRNQGLGRSATIGITGDQLLKNKKHAEVLESWDVRQKAVQDFVDSMINFTSEAPSVKTRDDTAEPNGKSVDLYYPNGLVIKCTEIQDPFGPTITDEQISALIISGETRSGGKAVNDKRKEKGWNELDVFEVDVLDADEGGEVKEGFQSKISSTAIREKIAKETQTPG